MRIWIAAVAVVVLVGARPNGQSLNLEALLERAGGYVTAFEQALSHVLSDETYRQNVRTLGTPSEPGANLMGGQRGDITIRSEMLFLWLPQERRWLAVRQVATVRQGDKLPRTVTDSGARLERLLQSPTSDVSMLSRIADDSARYNIGGVHRNYNTPTLALQLLDPAHRPNFTFAIAGEEKIRDVATVKIAFSEPKRPTLIALNGGDLPASGAIWIRPVDGVVVKTLLTVEAPEMTGSIEVHYERDGKLDMWVPTRMEERHTTGISGGHQRITGSAEYRNYRRFETGARLIPQR